MPVLTISAVDPATDQITVAAHGLNTGDGAAAVYTPDGTIPGGLAAVTDYWVIKVDANTLKLASSSSNAVAGTAIDITDAGSGTLQLLVGLPYRRATTYAAKTQVKSADLDSLQDIAEALWGFITAQGSFFGITAQAHGTRWYNLDASAYVGDSSAGRGTYDSTGHYLSGFSGVGLVVAPLHLEQNQRIIRFTQYYNVNGTGAGITPKIRRISLATGTFADVWVGTSDNSSSGIANQGPGGIDHVVLAGWAYFAEVTITNANHRVHGCEVLYDRPPS